MIDITLTGYLGSGPFYPSNGFELNKCNESWWTNLLYINNIVRSDKMVNNTQFFILIWILKVFFCF